MAKRMLIDANHQDETRVVVFNDNRLEEFDFESASRKQLKGNIYLAKVTRVEPSLQAAFVEYGGNRQGFLSFSEIHPDYYRIPIADRRALLAQEAAFEDDDDTNGESDDEPANGATASAANGEDERPGSDEAQGPDNGPDGKVEEVAAETKVDTVGGDDVEDGSRRRAQRLKRYKIQEVIKRRQVMLVQVSKEERGTKGAALTTYLSLAGRYCVLMPNTGKGGGISRKIASATDRRRLKKVISELEIPEGMAVIVRTAGSERSKVEIRRDYEYLVRLWNEIRETTLQSTAPCLIYEEANLIKRALRDLYTRDMEEILVEGEEGYKTAKAFVKNMIPSHARKVQLYKDNTLPLFHKFNVEGQLDSMHSSTVQLKSGGYIVLNQTEALVAIDVNSGKATRERHIEETALKTNLEASEEVARQLRLRDLAGLIVIDFIDMEESRHNRDVERRLKESMRQDRARIQLGRISPFGLLELSRQRLRPSLFESSTEACSRCGGTGHIRSSDSTALHVVRLLEEEAIKRGGGEIVIALPTQVAFYLMNRMRNRISEIEQRFGLTIRIEQDDALIPPDVRLSRLSESGKPVAIAEQPGAKARAEDEDGKRRRGRRRRRGKETEAASVSEPDELEEAAAGQDDGPSEAAESDAQGGERSRRRGRRGGRRRSRRRRESEAGGENEAASASPAEGPEPADEAATELPAEASEPATAANSEGEAPPPEAVASSEPAEAAAPRRRSSRRRTPKQEQTDKDGAEVSPIDPPAAAASDGEEKPAKRRRSRSAKPKADNPAPEAETPADPPPAAPDEQPDLAPLFPAFPAAPAADEPTASAPQQQLAPEGVVAPETSDEPTSGGAPDPDRPKRKGWWQRWV